MLDFPTEDFINRRTEYKFSGCTISLDLSLGLFSSAGVDAGSLLLLKSIAKEVSLDRLRSILDIGCGAGTLGLALASRCQKARVTMVDRDALAVDFTRHNAALNKRNNVEVYCRLMTEGPHQEPYDLIMSNFPAKAGETVLRDYLQRSMNLLEENGRGVLVIVHTLAELCRDLIGELNGTVLFEDASNQHTVFHYQTAGGKREPFDGSKDVLPLEPYIRHHGPFRFKRTEWELDTVWNISDFDSLSWRIQLLGEMLERERIRGTAAVWAPGQGHIPVSLIQNRTSAIQSLILADRDNLALKISRKNIACSNPELDLKIHSLSDPSLLSKALAPESLDLLVTDLAPVPRTDWSAPLKDCAAGLVKSGGLWAALGRSNDMAALLKHTRGWTPVADKRNKGWRGTIFRRNSR